MNEEIKKISLDEVEKFLPEALRRAITAYDARARQASAHMQAKEFTDHQKACKAAAAHIELLAKLARMTGLPGAAKNPNDRAVIDALLQEAERDVAGFGEERKR